MREVGSSTDLGQTLSVEEGPGAPMVGGKLQADAGNTRTSTTKKVQRWENEETHPSLSILSTFVELGSQILGCCFQNDHFPSPAV